MPKWMEVDGDMMFFGAACCADEDPANGSDHNHDLVYAPLDHDHDAVYADLSHNHDLDYAAVDHDHDAVYAPLVHDHSEYALGDDLDSLADRVGQLETTVADHRFVMDDASTDDGGIVPLLPEGADLLWENVTGLQVGDVDADGRSVSMEQVYPGIAIRLVDQSNSAHYVATIDSVTDDGTYTTLNVTVSHAEGAPVYGDDVVLSAFPPGGEADLSLYVTQSQFQALADSALVGDASNDATDGFRIRHGGKTYISLANSELGLYHVKAPTDPSHVARLQDVAEAVADGGVPARFVSDFAYKDNAVQYPKSFDMRVGGSAASGPHSDVTLVNLRIYRDDPFWKVADGLYGGSVGCPLIWRDDVGRSTYYVVRSVEKVEYESQNPYDKFSFSVAHDPPSEGDWGTTTSWGWDNFAAPFSIEIEFPDDVITRELLAVNNEYVARHGVEFTTSDAYVTFDGTRPKGSDFLKMRETWNSTSYAYLRNHPTRNGVLTFDFAGSGSSEFAFHWDQTGDVVAINRYGLKVNGSGVSRNATMLSALRSSTNFDELKSRLIELLEAEESEGDG